MFRRLGEHNYRAESPELNSSTTSISLSLHSYATASSQSADMSRHISSQFNSCRATGEIPNGCREENKVVEKPEMAMIEANLCKKLNTIVNLMYEFSMDAMGMKESADDLLDELRMNIRPFLINLDIEMCSVEALLRHNIDQSNIGGSRIDWLLAYTKYQNEMRRVITELAGTVYDDLEDSLELRKRGCISRRPCSKTIDNLQEMRRGMQRALALLSGGSRSTA